MEMNGTKPAGMTSANAQPSHLVTYQVCVDRDGEQAFDGTGQQFEDKAEALTHLAKVQRERPHAYLAALTYQRCDENGESSGQPAHGLTERLERIAGLANLGLRMTEKLQAVASLLGRLKPSEEDDAEQIADDLVIVVEAMVAQLQFLHELFDGIEVKTGYYAGAQAVRNREERSAHLEPAMV